MTTVPQQQKIPVAVKNHSNMPLPKHVIMTHDFGVLNPIECKVMFPGDHFTVKPNFFTYLNPMPCPTFGSVYMSTRAFFVPFRIIFKDWKEFISNQKVASGAHSSLQVPVLPWSDVQTFVRGFFGANMGEINTRFINPSGSRKDICVTFLVSEGSVGASERSYYELTYLGRQMLSILRGLGLNVPFVVDQWNPSQSQLNDADSELVNLYYQAHTKISVAPIVAFYKAYFDWIVPSRFLNSYVQSRRMLDIYFGERESTYKDNSTKQLTVDWWQSLLTCFPSAYLAPDYFTEAFTTQFGAESSEAYDTIIPNLDNSTYEFDAVETNTPSTTPPGGLGPEVRTSDGANRMAINALTLRSLGALQDMVNRGKIAGTKIQDWLRVTYGIQPGSDALDITTYLGKHSDDIQIGSVSSNADTYVETTGEGATLGQFAGRGLGGNQKPMTFTYDAKEHGLFILTCELNVKTSYWQGLRPEFEMFERTDFFLPEFDNINVEAIPQRRLNFSQGLNEYDNMFSYPGYVDPKSVFGFAPTYSQYKVNFDSLLGDFRVGGLNTGYDSWYLARFFTDNQTINNVFGRVVQDNTSKVYDRIFQNADNNADHFTTKWNIDIDTYRPMKPLNESLEFTENSGEKVKVDFSGEH